MIYHLVVGKHSRYTTLRTKMPKIHLSSEGDPHPISKERKGATPQASEGCNTSSAEGRDTSSQKGATPQARSRVLRANGKGFAQRKRPTVVVLHSDSSEGETPISTPHGRDQSRTDVPSRKRPHISDSGTDNSSLHSRNPPQKKSRAEVLADKYNPGTPIFDSSDIERTQDSTAKSSPEIEENDEKSYPIQCLEVKEKSLTLELEGVSKRIEEDKIREMELTGNLIGIRQAIKKLEESGL